MQLFTNNAKTTLANPIGSGTLSLTVATGTGALFPSPTGGDTFKITLFTPSGGDDTDIEIITVSARSGDTMTIAARGQEGTTAIAHAAGKSIQLRDTAGWHNAVEGALAARELLTNKNAANGYAGLNAFYAIQIKNAGGVVVSTLSSAALTARAYQLPNASGTIALTTDITGTNSGVNTGDQTITLTGDVAGTGTGTFAATIQPNAVTLGKMAQVATATLLGRTSAGTGNVESMSVTATKMLLVLNNVDNTSDAAKPVSSSQLAALNLKADKSDTYTKAEVDALSAALQVGDVRTTARTLALPDWMLTDGSAYLQSSYPALYAVVGAIFDPVKLTNPTTNPTAQGNGAAYSADSTYLAIAHTTSPFLSIYKRSGDSYTKLANPGTLPTGNGGGAAFSADGVYLAVAHDVSPFISIYKRAGDVFTKLANPATLPTSTGNDAAFSSDGTYLAVAHSAGGGRAVTIYKRSGDVFTKLADPDVLPSGNGFSVVFSPDTNYLILGGTGSTTLTAYKRTGDAFAKLPDLSGLPTGIPCTCAYSADGVYLAAPGSSNSATVLSIYKQTGDSFTKLSDPSGLPTTGNYSVAFSPDGGTLAVGGQGLLCMYSRVGDTFTRNVDPAFAPPGAAYGLMFSPDGSHLASASQLTPFLTIYSRSYDQTTQFVAPNYQPSASKLKNYIKT